MAAHIHRSTQLLQYCCFMVLTFKCQHRGVTSNLLTTPRDITVIKGSSVQISCSTTTDFVDWNFQRTDSVDGPYLLNFKRTVVEAFTSRHSLVTGTLGQFDLIINNTEMSDAGTYTCIDDGGLGRERASAELTVIDGSLVCTSNINFGGHLGTNEMGWDPSIINMTCTTYYRGKDPPKIHWLVKGQIIKYSGVQNIIRYNYKVSSSLEIPGDQIESGAVFRCETDSQPYTFNWTSPAVQIFETRNTSAVNETCGIQRVVCSTRRLPSSCTQRWKDNKNRTVSDGPILEITDRQSGYYYYCISECQINGRLGFVLTDIVGCEHQKSEGMSTISVIILVTVICLIIALITVIVTLFVHRQQSLKSQQEPHDKDPPGSKKARVSLIPHHQVTTEPMLKPDRASDTESGYTSIEATEQVEPGLIGVQCTPDSHTGLRRRQPLRSNENQADRLTTPHVDDSGVAISHGNIAPSTSDFDVKEDELEENSTVVEGKCDNVDLLKRILTEELEPHNGHSRSLQFQEAVAILLECLQTQETALRIKDEIQPQDTVNNDSRFHDGLSQNDTSLKDSSTDQQCLRTKTDHVSIFSRTDQATGVA